MNATTNKQPVKRLMRQNACCLALAMAVLLPFLVWWGGWGSSLFSPTPAFQPRGKILYQCGSKSPTYRARASLCEVHADGTNNRILYAYLPTNAAALAWSPDWKQIAFPDLNAGLLTAPVNDPAVNRANLNPTARDKPAWSPDGKTIAFAKIDGSGKSTGLYIMRVDRSDLRQFSKFGEQPLWSPDGGRIAFTNWTDGLYVADIHTGATFHLDSGLAPTALAWSPNGAQDCINTVPDEHQTPDQPPTASLSLINADGTNLRRYWGYYGAPAWSPDGSRLAYACDGGLCVMHADGSWQTHLWAGGAPFLWSPDGQYLVFVHHECWIGCGLQPDPSNELWIMRSDGSQQTKLVTNNEDPFISSSLGERWGAILAWQSGQ